jgi:hypothetical protein
VITVTKGQCAWQACKGCSGKHCVGPLCTSWNKLQLEFRDHKRGEKNI